MALAELLVNGPNASQIARRIGVPRTTLLGWPTFREHYDRAKQDQEVARRSRRHGRRAGERDFEVEEDE
jgi:transposase-like protein